jgi:hypothetical protein
MANAEPSAEDQAAADSSIPDASNSYFNTHGTHEPPTLAERVVDVVDTAAEAILNNINPFDHGGRE